MANLVVTKAEPSRLPDSLGGVAFWAANLTKAGFIEQVGRRLSIARSGGYAGVDLVVFLLSYWLSGHVGVGFKEFARQSRPWWSLLAAVWGRTALPSTASVSRMTRNLDLESVVEFGNWLLTGTLDFGLLRHPGVVWRGGAGERWHVFDYDLTHKALRQRALPAREGMPEPVRKGEAIASKGRAGRKRGELHLSRSVLQHAGTGLFVHMGIGRGSENALQRLADALTALREFVDSTGIHLDRTIFRADGAFGGVPSMKAIADARIAFVVRMARYAHLDKLAIRRVLAEAIWHEVPDSGSGPLRAATDVGWVLFAGATEAIRVRLVVSRYPVAPDAQGTKPARGHVIDGVCYEMYATMLPETSWTAAEVVALYYGRCGYQETRFDQEDRELNLDRIWAYTLPAQLLASLVGAFVWNLRIVSGYTASPPPDSVVPTQQPASAVVDERELPDLEVEEAQVEVEEVTLPTEESEAESASEKNARKAQVLAVMKSAARAAFKGSKLDRNGWTLTIQPLGVTCPANHFFAFSSVHDNTNPRAQPIAQFYRPRRGICSACPKAPTCRGRVAKHDKRPGFAVPRGLVASVLAPRRPKPSTVAEPLVRSILPASPALRPQPATFLPRSARRISTDVLMGINCEVCPADLPEPPPTHRLIASLDRLRRHGRCSHQENNQRYALPQGCEPTVRIDARNPAMLERLASPISIRELER